MTTLVLTIISAILGIAGSVFERRYSEDAIKERDKAKRDKAIVEHDSKALSGYLADLYGRVRRKNRGNS